MSIDRFPDPSEIRYAVGRVVAHCRVIHSWTQEDVARAAHLSQNAVSEIESAGRGVTFYTFLKLAYALRMSPGDFLEMILNRIGDKPEPLPRLGKRRKPNL